MQFLQILWSKSVFLPNEMFLTAISYWRLRSFPFFGDFQWNLHASQTQLIEDVSAKKGAVWKETHSCGLRINDVWIHPSHLKCSHIFILLSTLPGRSEGVHPSLRRPVPAPEGPGTVLSLQRLPNNAALLPECHLDSLPWEGSNLKGTGEAADVDCTVSPQVDFFIHHI